MNKEQSELRLNYNSDTNIISLDTYNEGFFNQSIDITNEVVDLVVEKLFNDLDCPTNGGIVELIRKRDKRDNIIKVIEQIKEQ